MSDATTDPTRDPQTGAWQYPPSWTPEQRADYEAAVDELATEERKLAKAEADKQAAAESPAAKIAAQRTKLADIKRAREAAETEAADDAMWASLCEKHGEGRLRRIYTEMGSIILRGMTEQESTAVDLRAQSVTASALEKGDEQRALRDTVKIYQEAISTKAALHPKPEKIKEITASYPGLWMDLYAARDELNRGRRVALGKGVAR